MKYLKTRFDFISCEMVPLATGSSPHSTIQLPNASDVVDTFLSMLAQSVSEIPKNEVCNYMLLGEYVHVVNVYTSSHDH